jgi:hypothetical protein
LLKNILILTLAVLFTTTLVSYYSSVSAQVTSNTTNTSLTQTIGNNFGTAVKVLFESPDTLILTGNPSISPRLWEALDLVKKSGYEVDAVSSFIEEPSTTVAYTIFLSK